MEFLFKYFLYSHIVVYRPMYCILIAFKNQTYIHHLNRAGFENYYLILGGRENLL